MRGTIEDIRRMRREVAVEGKRGKGLPVGAKVISIDSLDTTRPPGIERGQFEGPTE